MTNPTCAVCGSAALPHGPSWRYRCPSCRTWTSQLEVDINGGSHAQIDEDRRATGLNQLRTQNNERILDRLDALAASGGGRRLLDVGSAHGWFLTAAGTRGWTAEGIEPDTDIADAARAEGGSVRAGFFPDVLDPDERFDAICFNDVLEHLPDVRAAVAACEHHLAPGGLLSINIPSSTGAVFGVARLLERIRYTALSERLWQVGFPSPHLWYFDAAGLDRLCRSVGLTPVLSATLPSVVRRGLWQRAHEDRRPSVVSAVGVGATAALAPVLNTPRASDIIHLVARKAAVTG